VPDIGASAEVRALIDAGKPGELHRDTFMHQCWQRSRTGRTTKPTSVIALGNQGVRVVKLAHAGCADSHIIEDGAAAMRTLAGRAGARQHGHHIQGAGRQARCGENHLARKCMA
jgi:hypothetical protein